MIVEEEGEDLIITEGNELFTPHDRVVVIQYLVNSLSKMSGISYNEIMDDLKMVEVQDDEPTTEVKKVKKKKKERK